jgi:tetratricopeptide (TPR) repeat protein
MVGTDGHHVCDPEDGFLLGQQLEESEQMSHAADAYAFTIKRGGRYASDAALRLAHLVITRQAPGYSEERRSIVAARYYSIARQSTDPRTRAVANAGLMMLYDHDAYRPAVERLFNSSLLDPPEYVLALADACEEQASDHGERDAELWSSRAEQAYRTVASGSSDTAGWAAWRLGRMLQRQGNISGARQWLQQAAERDTGEAAADAALLLAQIEPDRWLNEAERRLNSVAQTGVTVPAESWLTLGDLQRDAKQPNKAFQAYRRAFKSSEMSVQVEAARRNAEVVRAAVHERRPEGEQLFDETLSMGALAAVCVGDALADEYPEKAEKAYRSGAARTTDIWSPDAQLRLGGIIGRRMADGDRDAAAEAEFHLRAAIYSGDMSVVPTAQVWLGDLMYLTGRLSSAERSYVQAMNGPDAAQRSIAAARVGRLFAEQERYTDAVAAYGAAMEGEDQWTVEAAQEMLNMTGRAPDLLWMVTEQLDRLARTGNRAALILGQQLMQEGEMELAERIFRIAAESTGVWAPDAARELGDLLVAQGRHEEGWDFLTRAATSDDFTVAPDAQQRLVTLLRDAIGRGGEEANAARALAERTGGAILHQVEAELGPPDQDGAVAVAPIDGAGPEESGGIGHDPADADRALG